MCAHPRKKGSEIYKPSSSVFSWTWFNEQKIFPQNAFTITQKMGRKKREYNPIFLKINVFFPQHGTKLQYIQIVLAFKNIVVVSSKVQMAQQHVLNKLWLTNSSENISTHFIWDTLHSWKRDRNRSLPLTNILVFFNKIVLKIWTE